MIIRGDCLDILRGMEPDSVDSLVTDPPAGISFMGKEWDKSHGFIPSMTEIFTECLRVLKFGAHGFVWAIPRTSHWTATALENAGFEIRDVVTHLFGSGFPKSKNCGNGIGTALKPASEHWILVRKPCSEKTVAANVLKHGTGGINIDTSRIGTGLDRSSGGLRKIEQAGADTLSLAISQGSRPTGGRFPANLILDEDAAEMLDEQSGVLQADRHKKPSPSGSAFFGSTQGIQNHTGREDKPGGASRFFYCAKTSKSERNAGCGEDQTLARSCSAQAGNEHEGSGFNKLHKMKNHHPTVKPKKLMSYLINMITPPGGLVLDPFAGSGSTGVAAIENGFQFIGIEKEDEYCTIAERRLEHAEKFQRSFF